MNAPGKEPTNKPLLEPLTRREREILELLAEGLTSSEMAERLTLAVSSVRWYLQQIYGKLGVNSKREAITRARDLDLLPSTPDQPTSIPVFNPPAAQPGPSLPTGIVTFLFTDIESSTPLWEKMPAEMQASVAQHHAIVRQAIETNGGQVYQVIGDEFQSAFRLAPQALKAALDMQQALQAAQWGPTGPIKVRMGLHTGSAELDPKGDAPYAVSHTLNRAARVRSTGYGGQILLSQATKDLVERDLPEGVTLRDLGEHQLKGLSIPEHLYQVCGRGLRENFPPLATQDRTGQNLPRQITHFIGRENVIAQVVDLLGKYPLVTLMGAGGVGKTRLSIKVAEEVLAQYQDGIWFIELAPTTDSSQVDRTVASTLGLREDPNRSFQDVLVEFLKDKHTLLVLDNCEHLVQACTSLVMTLLKACPEVRFLTTSREGLGVEGEITLRVPSMAFPNPNKIPNLEVFNHYDAVRLFTERANQVLPGFLVTQENAPAIAQICKQLDGIPLAIELAAARVRMLSVEQINARLDHVFRLLTGGTRTSLPRHQTLRATIDWSFQLLNEDERILLRRLSVFAGGCDLEAVEAVCNSAGGMQTDILDILSSLINKSMVVSTMGQGYAPRYFLLETVRQYAQERIIDAGEYSLLREQHMAYYTELSERAEPQLRGSGRLDWSQRLRREMDNLLSAIDWSYQDPNRVKEGLRLVTAIGFRFLIPEGHLKIILDQLQRGLTLAEGQNIPPLLLARAYNLIAEVYENQRNYPAVLEWVKKSLPILRGIGAPAYPDLIWALWDYGIAVVTISSDKERASVIHDECIHLSRKMGLDGAWYLGMSLFVRTIYMDFNSEYIHLIEESRRTFTLSGDRWSLVNPLDQLGEYAEKKKDFPKAISYFEEAYQLAEEVSDWPGLSYMCLHIGRILRKKGSFNAALMYYTRYVQLWSSMGNQEAIREGFVNLGLLFFALYAGTSDRVRQDYLQRAIRLLAASEKQRNQPFTFLYDRDLYEQTIKTSKQEWGETEFQRVWDEGQALTLSEAVAYSIETPTIE